MNFTFATARVTAHNPPFGVQVVFQTTGQNPSFPVQILRDSAGALQTRQKPLPQLGSWGIVLFPRGDLRNGIWLGSYYASKLDALTLTGPSGAAPTDPFIDYEAHYSGAWRLLDGLGNVAQQFADGSWMTFASGVGLPTTYRHTVSAGQEQQAIPFPFSERAPNAPGAFNFEFQHKSGTQVSVDSSGNVAVSGAAGATLTLRFRNISFTLGPSGATLDLPGSETFNITQGGASANDFLVLVSKLLTAFNGHQHSGVSTGLGVTGNPTVVLTANDLKSVVVDVSG